MVSVGGPRHDAAHASTPQPWGVPQTEAPTPRNKHATDQDADASRPRRTKRQASDFDALKRKIHTKLVDKLDLTRVGELEGDVLRREIRLVVEHLCDTEDTLLNRAERERLIEEVLDETFGLGRWNSC